METQTTTRNASLEDLAALLKAQQTRKLDVVVNAAAVTAREGVLVVKDAGQELGPEGVTTIDGHYRPTVVCDEGIADKLGIPVRYLKELRHNRPDLYDANVNGWLHGGEWGDHEAAKGDSRNFLLRAFTDESGSGEGIARAFLSDGYKRIDHLDILTASLQGATDAGAEVVIDSCDLSERKMQVRLVAPSITALAPTLLANYRSPFDQGVERAGGGTNHERTLEDARRATANYSRHSGPIAEPIVWAGVVISNSETGGGRFTIVPRLKVKVCNNGLTIVADAFGQVHLGARMEAGIVNWSEETQERNLELIRAQARDAMATYLNVDYLTAKVTEIEEKAGAPVTKPEQTVKRLGQTLRLSQGQTDSVLEHFILGGQMTAGGIVNAITSVAQTIADPDEASDLENVAMRALEVVSA